MAEFFGFGRESLKSRDTVVFILDRQCFDELAVQLIESERRFPPGIDHNEPESRSRNPSCHQLSDNIASKTVAEKRKITIVLRNA
jgi:hypothetical protein